LLVPLFGAIMVAPPLGAGSPATPENEHLSASPVESSKEEVATPDDAIASGLRPLRVMSLNFQYYSSYPADETGAQQKLRDALCVDRPDQAPDVVAVQEGLASRNVLDALGFDQVICSSQQEPERVAQTVREMVYTDPGTLKICPGQLHNELLCNQIYLRRDSRWEVEKEGEVESKGVRKVSSDSLLNGGCGRCQGKLAVRSMVWAKLRQRGGGRAAYVMCTHITGGRFEDQYFVQELCEERRKQPEACVDFFDQVQTGDDVGILVGDFNALDDYRDDGPMHGYYVSGIAGSEGVKADAEEAGLSSPEEIEGLFKKYMVSPFKALRDRGWTFAYDQSVGITSAFGHLIDHMATSVPLQQEGKPEVRYLTNQKFSKEPPDTELVVTDHNAVVVTFLI